VQLPLPPGCLLRLCEDEDLLPANVSGALPGYYLSGDGGYVDAGGYLFVMGRVDDVINVAGHRL
jgi:propionyl-CoA synthetase